MLTGIDHIDLYVDDVQKTKEMLIGFGMKVRRETPPPRNSVEIGFPVENQPFFEIRPAKDGAAGLNHIAFKVSEDHSNEELKAQGIVFTNENKLIEMTGRTVSNFNACGIHWQLTD